MSDPTRQTPAAFFHFLTQSFQYPEQSWLTESYFDLFVEIAHNLGLAHNVPMLCRQYCNNAQGLEILQIEYTRLFINAVPSVIAPPYSSVYLDGEGTLFGPSAEEVKRFYQHHGFDLAGSADIPDHLTLELEFLALLIDDQQHAAAEQFLHHHFRIWFPRFQERVLTNTTNPFYTSLISMVDFFTREEP